MIAGSIHMFKEKASSVLSELSVFSVNLNSKVKMQMFSISRGRGKKQVLRRRNTNIHELLALIHRG